MATLLTQANGLICYRQPVPTVACDSLTGLVGTITSDTGGLHPTLAQCYQLLQAQWFYVTNWLADIFPHFTPPAATATEVYAVKTVLWLWILQFGPSELKTDPLWQGLVQVFNSVSLDWEDCWPGREATSQGAPTASLRTSLHYS